MERFGNLFGVYVLCIVIPILIINKAFKAVSKDIKQCLIMHAIPSMIATVINLLWCILVLTEVLELKVDAVITSYAPLWTVLFAYLGYVAGRGKVRRMQADLVRDNQIDIMDIRGRYRASKDLTK